MDSHGSVSLDESPPDGLIPPQPSQRGSRGLFFRGPATEELEEEQESPLQLVTEAAGDDASVSEGEWSEFADPSDAEPASSTASPAGDRPAQLLSKRQMRETAETAILIGTGMAHTVAAKTPAQRQVGLYQADEDDAKAIGHPLADLMYRRGDVVGGKLSPDANDFLRSLMGVAGYFAKQVAKVGVIRQLEAGAVAEPQAFAPDGA